MKTHKSLHKDIKDASLKLQEHEDRIKELTSIEINLRKQHELSQAKLFRLQKSFEEKRQSALLALDQAQQEKLNVGRLHARDQAKIEQTDAMIKQIQKEVIYI